MRQHPGITLTELAAALGVGVKRVDQIVGRLEAAGRVQRQPGTWEPPPFEQ